MPKIERDRSWCKPERGEDMESQTEKRREGDFLSGLAVGQIAAEHIKWSTFTLRHGTWLCVSTCPFMCSSPRLHQSTYNLICALMQTWNPESYTLCECVHVCVKAGWATWSSTWSFVGTKILAVSVRSAMWHDLCARRWVWMSCLWPADQTTDQTWRPTKLIIQSFPTMLHSFSILPLCSLVYLSFSVLSFTFFTLLFLFLPILGFCSPLNQETKVHSILSIMHAIWGGQKTARRVLYTRWHISSGPFFSRKGHQHKHTQTCLV